MINVGPPRDMDVLRFDLEPEEATFPLVHKEGKRIPITYEYRT